MTTIILPTQPTSYVDFFKNNYENIIAGRMLEKEVVEYIEALLPLAKGCNVSPNCFFWMFDDPETMPSDCRIAYVYEPTYYGAASIIYAVTKYDSVAHIEGLFDTLENILMGCKERNFEGHGFDYVEGFLRAMDIFAKANTMEFLSQYGERYKFFEIFFKERVDYMKRELLSGNVRNEWTEEDYCKESKIIMDMLESNDSVIRLFVYGTLMRGQRADYYLDRANYVGTYRLSGYAMYNLGQFPGIKDNAKESVIGEVYEISEEMLANMDRYESEGSLYIRKTVSVSNDLDTLEAYVYVYNHDVDGTPMREKWGADDSDRVWYACYGSNLNSDRFLCYIRGGICVANGRTYSGCNKDKSLWTDSKIKEFKGQLYFGNTSSSWGGKGVAFFDPSAEGKTIMRLYNISRSQLLEVQQQEGTSSKWYGRRVCLGVESGLPVYTFTSEERRSENVPSDQYVSLIRDALIKECNLAIDSADSYIKNALG